MLDNIKKMELNIDREKHHLFAVIKVSTKYNIPFDNDREHMYSYRFNDNSTTLDAEGYCEKEDVGCRKLFANLKENESCIVSLDAWYPQKVFEYITLPGYTGRQMEIGNIQVKVCWP